MEREQQFKDRLRGAGERLTSPRLGIFRILVRQAPVAMAKLIARGQADGIDPVTTYRTVDLFRKLGLVSEAGLGRNRLLELSDEVERHHHHLSCVVCGKLVDFDNAAIEAELGRVGEQTGFAIRSHQLEATGVCAACQAKAGELV